MSRLVAATAKRFYNNRNFEADRYKIQLRRFCKAAEKTDSRYNDLGIQMLSQSLHAQVFKETKAQILPNAKREEIKKHLEQHGLWNKKTPSIDDVSVKLPKLEGRNIEDHFRIIADNINNQYLKYANALQNCTIPPEPEKWAFHPGWSRYDPVTGKGVPVDYPKCKALVFDMEVLVQEGNFPTMATAVSPDYWYSWVSPRVFDQRHYKKTTLELEDLIHFENSEFAVSNVYLLFIITKENNLPFH